MKAMSYYSVTKPMSRLRKWVIIPVVLVGSLLALSACSGTESPIGSPEAQSHKGFFKAVTTYKVNGAVAEIVAATPDGLKLIYTNSADQNIGVVDISNPAAPTEIVQIPTSGEPTSVAITPDGRWALTVVHGSPDYLQVTNLSNFTQETTINLGGQPDSIAISPDGRYAAIAIENQRDENVNGGAMPQSPAGFLTIVDLVGQPLSWKTRDVSLIGIADRFPDDPEPEFVDINKSNQVAVTLQENNHIAVFNLATGALISDWSAGISEHYADTQDDGKISFTNFLSARREPDGIAWTPAGRLITANEGDYDVDLAPGQFSGGRDFSIWSRKLKGKLDYSPGNGLEVAAANAGLYNDSRSDVRGCEFEGVEVGTYSNGVSFAFIGAERCGFVGVYRLNYYKYDPTFIQVLPTGSRPEGLLAIPQRSLFVSANEGDGTISIFEGVF
jgi:WD40 repeat protein